MKTYKQFKEEVEKINEIFGAIKRALARRKANKQKKTDPKTRKPGTVWETPTGWGGMHRQTKEIKYFDDKNEAIKWVRASNQAQAEKEQENEREAARGRDRARADAIRSKKEEEKRKQREREQEDHRQWRREYPEPNPSGREDWET